MRVREFPGWPPSWIRPGQAPRGLPQGDEVGVLSAVEWLSEQSQEARTIRLTREHGGRHEIGFLASADDPVLLERLHALLATRVGQELSDIGWLRIPGT